MHLFSLQPRNRYTALQALRTIRPSVQSQLDAFARLLETETDAAIDRHPSASVLVEHFNADLDAALQLPLPRGGRVAAVAPVVLPVLA